VTLLSVLTPTFDGPLQVFVGSRLVHTCAVPREACGLDPCLVTFDVRSVQLDALRAHEANLIGVAPADPTASATDPLPPARIAVLLPTHDEPLCVFIDTELVGMCTVHEGARGNTRHLVTFDAPTELPPVSGAADEACGYNAQTDVVADGEGQRFWSAE
jgi:hypothetical protein